MDTKVLLDSIEEAKILCIFKNVCNDYSNSVEKNKLRNILAVSPDKYNTIKQIMIRKYSVDMNDQQIERMLELIRAFLKKSDYRKNIPVELREKLLSNQEYKCFFCGKNIDISSHADHIVPFKYVGDELDDNLQMLCGTCNEKKSDSIDYQIRYLLKLV